jgi:hypothetical protein
MVTGTKGLMKDNYISIFNLIDFVEELSEELDCNAYSWFDRTSVASLVTILK